MTMLFLLLIPVLAVVGFRLYRANTKVTAILREELQEMLRDELPAPPEPPMVALDPVVFQPDRPVTIGAGAGRTESP